MTSFVFGRSVEQAADVSRFSPRLSSSLRLVALLGATCALIALLAAVALIGLLVELPALGR